MMEALGLVILSLKRLSFGPIELSELERGEWRELREDEITALRGASSTGSELGQQTERE
jgi:16S rRNA U516 pseudouridylate synthase RsuA-like enzyme